MIAYLVKRIPSLVKRTTSHASRFALHASRPAIFLALLFLANNGWTEPVEVIKSIEIQNQIPERRPDILALIRMKEGDTFDREKMENAIYDLRKWGVFKNVEAIVEHEGNSVSLIFQLVDAYILKDIEIHGNFPLLEKKVKRAI